MPVASTAGYTVVATENETALVTFIYPRNVARHGVHATPTQNKNAQEYKDGHTLNISSVVSESPTSTDVAAGEVWQARDQGDVIHPFSELPTCNSRTNDKMVQANTSSSGLYHHLFVELADPRTSDWFLMRDPWPGLVIIGLYLYFCLSWGPRFMERREPMQLKKTLIVYNFLQVLFSCWLCYQGLDAAWLKYSWKCQPIDYSMNPEAVRFAGVVYMYFVAKLSELLDTVFFVLRKKNKQITFLHMYHHTIMPMGAWYAVKYFPGGHITFLGLINSFVHIIMYAYYMLAAMGPQFEKYLFWKKYITKLQLLQFCIAFLHSSQLLFHDCGFPRWTIVLTMPNAVFFYYLFSDFYAKAYSSAESKNGRQSGRLANDAYDGKSAKIYKADDNKHVSNSTKTD